MTVAPRINAYNIGARTIIRYDGHRLRVQAVETRRSTDLVRFRCTDLTTGTYNVRTQWMRFTDTLWVLRTSDGLHLGD